MRNAYPVGDEFLAERRRRAAIVGRLEVQKWEGNTQQSGSIWAAGGE
jgi:hypothetical protein